MGFLKKLFSKHEAPPPHPVFGKLELYEFERGNYWEAGTEAFGVSVETTGDAPPSEAQVRFYQRIVGDMDAAFALAAPLLVPAYEARTGKPFPSRWRDAFEPVGMSVPLDGLDENPWDLSFDCLTDDSGAMFTCSFERGAPVDCRIDS